ncbi:type II toxin-antitoxin system RelE/ParE family toxin [Lacihabitans sp. LS3-19]|uniref:type II toxin-antitoxin system RelE/ParE family toxin n=1 Tax=Lacihabitans sp. LS3-19 TaxID=2487335 RepID=UPI0020CC354C|nr:type II toxin-antitoxin system RelE/ParE family toxin [Lacihabitans sp. LS3-19]MCP9769576.1 type II toxin-antitoxin system RelE/ParE family toxin [Lacihabitans sp. LS3-19]
MYTVLISSEAEQDLDNVWSWYESQKKELGMEFIMAFNSTISSICNFPFSKPKFKNKIRRCLMSKYPFGVYYLVNKKELELKIIAVLHFKRGSRFKKSILTQRK